MRWCIANKSLGSRAGCFGAELGGGGSGEAALADAEVAIMLAAVCDVQAGAKLLLLLSQSGAELHFLKALKNGCILQQLLSFRELQGSWS